MRYAQVPAARWRQPPQRADEAQPAPQQLAPPVQQLAEPEPAEPPVMPVVVHQASEQPEQPEPPLAVEQQERLSRKRYIQPANPVDIFFEAPAEPADPEPDPAPEEEPNVPNPQQPREEQLAIGQTKPRGIP